MKPIKKLNFIKVNDGDNEVANLTFPNGYKIHVWKMKHQDSFGVDVSDVNNVVFDQRDVTGNIELNELIEQIKGLESINDLLDI